MRDKIIIDIVKHVLTTEANGILKLAENIDDDYIHIISLLFNLNGKIIVSGMGKSGHIARKIAATFASTGSPAYFVHPSEASHGDLGMIEKNDVIICLSNSGETRELGDVINYGKRFEIPIIAITAKRDSLLANIANYRIILPQADEACDLVRAPTTSTTMTLAVGDALAISLMKLRGFGPDDFQNFHPGGKLGASLTKISDIMHEKLELPLCDINESLSSALKIMNSLNFGCVGITKEGNLIGIITDGDLRRKLVHILDNNDLNKSKINDIMTSNPKILSPNTLASEALNYLAKNKITALFVVENEKPVGIINIHDFLKLGVM